MKKTIEFIENIYEKESSNWKITNAINEMLNKGMKLSINFISDYSDISISTISRYIRNSGYSNFKNFTKHMYLSKNNKDISIEELEENINDYLSNLFTHHKLAMNEFKQKNNVIKYKNICEDILKSKRVFVMGIGQSRAAVEYLTYVLNILNIPTITHSDYHTMLEWSCSSNKNDFVIFFTKSGKNHENAFMYDVVKNNYSKVLVVSSTNILSNDYNDHVILHDVHNKNDSLNSNSFKTSQNIIAESLILTILELKPELKSNFTKIKKVMSEWRNITNIN